MKQLFTFPSTKFLCSAILLSIIFFPAFTNNVNAQIISYTSATNGSLNSVAANASGTALALVNGATSPGTSCGTGFSVSGFSTKTAYNSSLAAVQVTCTPNTGYTLNISGFSAGLRRSASGPTFVTYAYSINGGSTWVKQTARQTPDSAACGVTTTGKWSTKFTVPSGTAIMFRIYGYKASSNSGILQILNLLINGTVKAVAGCGIPSGLSVSSITAAAATLKWAAVSGAVSYNIQYRQTGAASWTTVNSTADSVAVSGLTPNTNYQFQMQAVCSGSSSGSYTAPLGFTTAQSTNTGSSGKIAIYFNHPVDTTVSTGVKAVYLNSCMADTLIAYINRAKYSIDIAQYEYSQTTGFSNIATAINNAYSRGVVVRWIYCAGGTNTGLSALNAGIHTLSSPAAGTITPCNKTYDIMHNKFVLIDANSSNPNDALVWTGSPDWNVTQFNSDYNNVIIIQDSALAHAYTNQFNLMWGSTTATPNAGASLWGPCKPNSGRHIFTIAGKEVELYFSPSDSTNSHILSTIATANTDMYFGVYTFTSVPDANQLVTEYSSGGVMVDGIVDEYSTSYNAYPVLNAGLGTTHFKVYNGGSYIYHNKYLVVDPSNTCSDPMVLTGSHNWTTSADVENDENTLIIHNDTTANIYYQAFKGDFNSLGGTLSHIAVGGGCGTSYTLSKNIQSSSSLPALNSKSAGNSFIIYPNPTRESFMIQYNVGVPEHVTVNIYTSIGQLVAVLANNEMQETGSHSYTFAPFASGIYIVRITFGSNTYTAKVVKM